MFIIPGINALTCKAQAGSQDAACPIPCCIASGKKLCRYNSNVADQTELNYLGVNYGRMLRETRPFDLVSTFSPSSDQEKAINILTSGLEEGEQSRSCLV